MAPYWLCLVPMVFAAVLVVAACARSSQLGEMEAEDCEEILWHVD